MKSAFNSAKVTELLLNALIRAITLLGVTFDGKMDVFKSFSNFIGLGSKDVQI